jgi:hypothetical protein
VLLYRRYYRFRLDSLDVDVIRLEYRVTTVGSWGAGSNEAYL